MLHSIKIITRAPCSYKFSGMNWVPIASLQKSHQLPTDHPNTKVKIKEETGCNALDLTSDRLGNI